MKSRFCLVCLLALFAHCRAQDETQFKLSGFADTYHALRSSKPWNFLSSRTRLRTELDVSRGNSSLFASMNAMYNGIIEDQTGIELREAYFDFSSKHWNIRAGKQIVIWGVSDGLRITDVVSPMDMTEFLARDYDDIRIPVNALKVGYSNTFLRSELIFIPSSSYYILPVSSQHPWSLFPPIDPLVYEVDLEQYPEKTLKNSEFGGRISFFLSGLDFSLSALHTWNKMPVFQYSVLPRSDTIYADGLYKRMDMLGMDFSFPLWQFVIRAEAAAYLNEVQASQPAFWNEPIRRNTANFLLGLDWYPGKDWTLSAQYTYKYIPDHVDGIMAEENPSLGTMGITKKLLRSTLGLSVFGYVDLNNQGFFMRGSADYSLTDQIHLLAGYDWFDGDKGLFALYKKNSEIWIKAKYSF